MGADNNFVRIQDSRIDADSPITEQLMFDAVSGINHGFALVRSDGSALMAGTFDSDPTNTGSSRIVDAGPSAGSIGNVLVGHYLEMTTGTAKGSQAKVVAIRVGSSRLTLNTNLYSLGARSGDGYEILYGMATDKAHRHSDVDSPALAATSGTFEYEAGRSTGISNSGYTTVSFGTPFTYPPVIACTGEEGDSGVKVAIRNVTTTGFDVKSDSTASHAVHWFACTAGRWKFSSGALIYAQVHTIISSEKRDIPWPRPFDKSPGLGGACCENLNTNVAANQVVVMGGQTFNTTAGTNLNFALRMGLYVGLFTANQGDVHVIAVSATGNANNGTGTYTSGGAGLIGATPYEAGFARASSATGTVTFSAAFAAAPAVLLLPVNTENLTGLGATHVNLTANAGTTSFPYRHSSVTNGFAWMAFKREHGSLSATLY